MAEVGEDEGRVGSIARRAIVCREAEEDVCGFNVSVDDRSPFG